jgi:tetratricopeptide (TPR) repeat protein
MRNLGIILALLLFNISSFAQWKSHYPEGKSSKKEQKKVDNEKNKKMFDAHFFNALKAKSLEDYDEALNHFEKSIKLDNKNPHPFYESAIINAANGSYVIAIEQIKIAVNLEPENKWYSILYAEILFSKQDFVGAAIQYKKIIALEPGNEELYFKLSDTYIYAKNLKKAIGVYDDLEAHKGIDKMLSMQKHKLYRELNDMKGAINELYVMLNVFPNDIEAMQILAELYLLNDEKEKAFELFKSLAIIAPNNGRIHLTLADYYRENGDNKKSYNELKLAFKSRELNIDTKVRILVSYYQLIALNEDVALQAYELAETLIQTHPEDLKARAVFADILYTDNKYQEAKEQYLIVLERDKSKSQVWGQLLFIQAEQNDFEGMLNTSKQALEYFPADPLFYYFNGYSNKWFESYDDAINSLEMGVEFIIDNKKLLLEFYSSLADIHHTIKQYKLSDEYYEKVLEIDPNNILALNNYAYYLSVRKINLEKAKEMSFRCNELEVDNGTYQDTYAWILYELKEYKLAKEWLLKALLNGSDKSAVVVEHYGDILYRIGEAREALNQWKKAKELGGDSKSLNQKIEEERLYE